MGATRRRVSLSLCAARLGRERRGARGACEHAKRRRDVVLLDAAANASRAREPARVALLLVPLRDDGVAARAAGRQGRRRRLAAPAGDFGAPPRVAARAPPEHDRRAADLVGPLPVLPLGRARRAARRLRQDVEIRVAQELRPRRQLAPRLDHAPALARRRRLVAAPQRIGPFHFTRGPAYFVGAGIVRQLLDDVILQAHMRATLDAADVATNLSTTLPWEDVYTGLALSEAAHGADLAYVHVGCEVYCDEWGFFAAPSTLIWHMRSKIASRIRELQAWSEARHCAPPGRLECGDDWSGCNGQRWRRCEWRYDAPPPPPPPTAPPQPAAARSGSPTCFRTRSCGSRRARIRAQGRR